MWQIALTRYGAKATAPEGCMTRLEMLRRELFCMSFRRECFACLTPTKNLTKRNSKKKRNDAKKHLEQLKGYYENLGVAWGDAECNPMTDIDEVLKELKVL